MNIEILELLPEPVRPRNAYEFVFEFMHGDGDHYEYESVVVPPDLFDTLEVLICSLGSCPRSEQLDLPGFKEIIGKSLPTDITNRSEYVRVSYNGVFWYDENGRKHLARIK